MTQRLTGEKFPKAKKNERVMAFTDTLIYVLTLCSTQRRMRE